MTFSGRGSYRKDASVEYSHSIQYVINKLEGIMTAFRC